MRFYNSSKIDLICRCHFGGGGGGTPPPMPKFEMPPMPKMPEPPPAPAPMPERVDQSVSDAQQQARQAAARRDGARKSMLAGETGGYSNPVTGNSLLG
jgi:hypothetical protein